VLRDWVALDTYPAHGEGSRSMLERRQSPVAVVTGGPVAARVWLARAWARKMTKEDAFVQH